MKKIITLALAMIMVSACGTTNGNDTGDNEQTKEDNQGFVEEERENEASERQVGDVIIAIYTDKRVYKEGESIEAWTETKYVGDKEDIEIAHGGRIYFNNIEQLDGDFSLEGAMNQPLLHTTIKRTVPHREDFVKSGGFSEEDGDEKFWQEFFKEDGLYLPSGTYELIAVPTFYYMEEGKEKRVEQPVSTVITVE